MTDTAVETVPTVQYVPQTARDFLASVIVDGKPLAIPGTRGRFSKAATEALAKAHADGFVFLGEPGHPDTEVKAKREPKAKPAPAEGKTVVLPTQTAPAPAVDAKEVRAWARANGHTVGERGRLNPTVVSAYLAAGGKAVGPKAKATAPKPVKVRTQTVAYGRVRRGDLPKHISEPLLAITNCFRCKAGIAYCACEHITMPKWAGGEAAVLTKAEAK